MGKQGNHEEWGIMRNIHVQSAELSSNTLTEKIYTCLLKATNQVWESQKGYAWTLLANAASVHHPTSVSIDPRA